MRALLEHERPLVDYLFELACLPVDLDTLLIEPMDDGGMGSLTLDPPGRSFGSSAAECHFYDSNGIVISAMLNLDKLGVPFEIDIWKVDSSATRQWPARSALHAGPPGNLIEPTSPPSTVIRALGIPIGRSFMPSSRDKAYLDLLYYGLVFLRNWSRGGRVEFWQIEAEHLHEIPTLIGETNERRHIDYLRGTRGLYLQQLRALSDAAYWEKVSIWYSGPWQVLADEAKMSLPAWDQGIKPVEAFKK
jgi:hypothetical protein